MRNAAALAAKNEKLKAERTTNKEFLLDKENLFKESLKNNHRTVRSSLLRTGGMDTWELLRGDRTVEATVTKEQKMRIHF